VHLSTKVLAGLFLGIAVGLFFGERTAPLQVVGDAFIQLLQMAVLPYVVVSLIAGLGSLSASEARRLAWRGGAVLLALWTLTFSLVAVTPFCFPESRAGTFFRAESLQPPAQLDFLSLYITSNPFHALANNVVPAVVLFSSLLGIALIGVETRQPLINGLHTISRALLRVTGFIVRLTPLGVFAISGYLAGTSTIEELGRIQVFLWTYLAFVLILAVWILPGVLAAFTPLRYRTILHVSRDALVTAFATGSAFVVLPLLAESGKRLLAERHLEAEDSAAMVDAIIPLAQTFPHAAKVLSLSFVLFAGWFVGSPLALHDYPLLGLAGIMSLFGSVHLAIPYMLDVMHVPVDTYGVFVATSVINAHFGTLGAAMHILTLTLLSTCAITGAVTLQWTRIAA
jgi:proton glutamate symport protein